MKRKTFYLYTDIYRLFIKKETYIGIAGIVLALFLSIGNKNDIAESVIYTLLLSTYNVGFILFFIFCSLPYGTIYVEELENNYIKYVINRGGLKKYVLSKNIVIFLSSIFVTAVGIILFAWICALKLPWIDEQTFQILMSSGSHTTLLKRGSYIAWIGLYGMQWGLFGGCLALISSYLSLYIRNKLLVLAMPILLYQIIIEIGTTTFRKNSMLDPLVIFDARYNLFSNDAGTFLWACTIGIICFAAVNIGIYKKIQKGM